MKATIVTLVTVGAIALLVIAYLLARPEGMEPGPAVSVPDASVPDASVPAAQVPAASHDGHDVVPAAGRPTPTPGAAVPGGTPVAQTPAPRRGLPNRPAPRVPARPVNLYIDTQLTRQYTGTSWQVGDDVWQLREGGVFESSQGLRGSWAAGDDTLTVSPEGGEATTVLATEAGFEFEGHAARKVE